MMNVGVIYKDAQTQNVTLKQDNVLANVEFRGLNVMNALICIGTFLTVKIMVRIFNTKVFSTNKMLSL